MKTDERNTALVWLWKIPAIAAAYFVGVVLSGAVITALGLQWPSIPEPLSQTAALGFNLISSLLMAACMAWIALGIRGSRPARWLILTLFTYVTFGLNNQIEAAIFTTFGGTAAMIVFYIAPSMLGAAAAVSLFRPNPAPDRSANGRQMATQWWRFVIGWLAFPVIYLFFGMLAAPFVVPAYQSQNFGLTLPGWGTLLPVALARSALYLAVTIPIFVTWSRSRRSLFLCLATAFFAMMGLIGLLTATFFPPVLRVTHSIEILGDAVVYAWLLVSLFVPKARHEISEAVAAVADS